MRWRHLSESWDRFRQVRRFEENGPSLRWGDEKESGPGLRWGDEKEGGPSLRWGDELQQRRAIHRGKGGAAKVISLFSPR